MFIFIIGFILILLMCYFKKKKDFIENLIVSPTKLYSLNNSQSKNMCTFNNIPSKNYKTFINLDQYLSIKNLTASLDLVGYKICLKLDKVEYSLSNCNPDKNQISSLPITEEDIDSANTNIDFNNLTNLAVNADKNIDLDYDYKCEGNKCWYNATIINHILINNLNVHKIGWYNNLLFPKTKWVILSNYDIKLPVSKYSSNFPTINFNSSSTKKDSSSNNQNLQYLKTNLLSKPLIKQNNTSQSNIPNCLDPLEKNYLGRLYCNKNKDCFKYGSYICNRGLCENNYLNINIKN